MEIFTEALLKELINSIPQSFALASEFKGQIASGGMKLILLPFHEFSLISSMVAIGWIIIFWKNKGLIFSGISNWLDNNGK